MHGTRSGWSLGPMNEKSKAPASAGSDNNCGIDSNHQSLLTPSPMLAAALTTDGSSESALFAANLKGIVLAVTSSAFIGASFILKKKGLKRSGVGGYGYLLEPLWWVDMITMIIGEIANFVAYIFAPAILVTPLGALNIIVSVLGCILCVVGSTVIVLHAPEERTPSSVEQIWDLAIHPAFLLYAASAAGVSLVLMLHSAPRL